jgi:MFS family permease
MSGRDASDSGIMRGISAPPDMHVAARPHELGIRINLGQFIQQVIQVAFVGLVIGMERNAVPALAGSEFGVAKGSFFFLLSFVLSFGLVKGVVNFVAGRLADHIGRKKVLVAGWVAAVPIPFMIGYAPNWGWVVAANLLLGLNQGLAWTMTVTSKIDITRPEQRGFATGINELGGYLAVGAASIATGYLAAVYGARSTVLAFGLVVIAIALAHAVIFVRETLPWARAERRGQTEGRTPGSKVRFPAGFPEHPNAAQIFLLVSVRDPTFCALCQAGVANKIADALIWSLLPVFLHERGLNLVAIGWVAGVYAMVWGLAQPLAGLLADRVGRKRPVVAGLWMVAAGVASTALERSLIGWVTSAVVMGLGMALLYPNLIAAVADISQPQWRASSLGTYRYWRDTGYMIGAIVLGAIAQWRAEPVSAFWFTAAVLFASGLWLACRAEETLVQVADRVRS